MRWPRACREDPEDIKGCFHLGKIPSKSHLWKEMGPHMSTLQMKKLRLEVVK